MITPTEIRRLAEKGLAIRWSNGESAELSSKCLRENCPCATCRESRGDATHQKPLGGKKSSLRIIENTIDQELELKRVWPVGQYAIGIEWGDGHSTGIYTFEYLAQLRN